MVFDETLPEELRFVVLQKLSNAKVSESGKVELVMRVLHSGKICVA